MAEQIIPMKDISDEDLSFLALYRGRRHGACRQEEDKQQLRKHVIHLWHTCLADASVLYGCVQEMLFLTPRVHQHPHYAHVLNTIQADLDARFLELGCCFGTDARKVIVDGWKEENVVAVDVIPEFWNYGLKLYEDQSTLKIKFCSGDVTEDPAFVQTLADEGPFAHAWTGAVLHVLSEAKVESLVASVLAMLKPGGTYFGNCVGVSGQQPQDWQPELRNRAGAFHHTASSLKMLLERLGFMDVEVKDPPMAEFLPAGSQLRERAVKANMKALIYTAKKPLSDRS